MCCFIIYHSITIHSCGHANTVFEFWFFCLMSHLIEVDYWFLKIISNLKMNRSNLVMELKINRNFRNHSEYVCCGRMKVFWIRKTKIRWLTTDEFGNSITFFHHFIINCSNDNHKIFWKTKLRTNLWILSISKFNNRIKVLIDDSEIRFINFFC